MYSLCSLVLSLSLPLLSLSLSLPPSPTRLLAHVFDPELDQAHAREFVVYACPQGALGRQVEEFMEATLYQCGRNGAHKSFPHATLCQFFKVWQHTIIGNNIVFT